MALAYPRRVDLARTPTPLQYLERATKRWGRGHRLWVKRDDLTGCTLSGNKVRKLEFIAAYAQDHGYDTLITCGGLQSNHCRATAFAGARLGLGALYFVSFRYREGLEHLTSLAEDGSAPDDFRAYAQYFAGAAVDAYIRSNRIHNIDALSFIELPWPCRKRKRFRGKCADRAQVNDVSRELRLHAVLEISCYLSIFTAADQA